MVTLIAATDTSVTDTIWALLQTVPDPEIPVVSVVELGIVQNVSWQDGTAIITVTPTYSGCPATAVIALSIQQTLRENGFETVDIKTQLSPAWTTDWITEEARKKLKAYGIAPPVDGTSCAGSLMPQPQQTVAIACPRCASENTERVSQFGSTPCKASYRCKDCLEPFDYFKSF